MRRNWESDKNFYNHGRDVGAVCHEYTRLVPSHVRNWEGLVWTVLGIDFCAFLYFFYFIRAEKAWKCDFYLYLTFSIKTILKKVDIVALVIVNSVYLAVVINYATQCEMIIFYIDEVRTRLEEKSITIKEAMQVNSN